MNRPGARRQRALAPPSGPFALRPLGDPDPTRADRVGLTMQPGLRQRTQATLHLRTGTLLARRGHWVSCYPSGHAPQERVNMAAILVDMRRRDPGVSESLLSAFLDPLHPFPLAQYNSARIRPVTT